MKKLRQFLKGLFRRSCSDALRTDGYLHKNLMPGAVYHYEHGRIGPANEIMKEVKAINKRAQRWNDIQAVYQPLCYGLAELVVVHV